MLARIDAGTGETILLVHGVGDSAAGWSDLIASLQKGYRVIAIDQRGHGLSPRFDMEQLVDPFRVLVDDLLSTLEEVGPAVVIGHSMGGAVAAEAAIQRPDLFHKLVLEDPAWFERTREETELVGQARVLSKQRNRENMDKAMGDLRAKGWSAVETHAWAAAHDQTQTDFLATGIVAQSRPWREVQQDLASSGLPVLVVVGNGADSIVDKRDLVLPFVEFDAGHCIRREQPEDYLAALRSFVGAAG